MRFMVILLFGTDWVNALGAIRMTGGTTAFLRRPSFMQVMLPLYAPAERDGVHKSRKCGMAHLPQCISAACQKAGKRLQVPM
jgi:hypothetical protein